MAFWGNQSHIMQNKHIGTEHGLLGAAPVDRRITDIIRDVRQLQSNQTGISAARDPYHVNSLLAQQLTTSDTLQLGTVIQAIPFAHWYRVQMPTGQGNIPACSLATTGLLPMGPRMGNMYPPGSTVLVWKPKHLHYGFIVGTVPAVTTEARLSRPDFLQQDGQTGFRRDLAHSLSITNSFQGGGILDWSANRPLDSTTQDFSIVAETGLAFLMDSFQTYLRVNEQCGLFLNYFDSYTRLAGVQLDVQSGIHELRVRDDEGESRYFLGVALYPWESFGLYLPGTTWTKEYDPLATQTKIARAVVDLPEGSEDVQPIYRLQEYRGYQGQGVLRYVARPTQTSGVQTHSDDHFMDGLCMESIISDGSWTVQSAKMIGLFKRGRLPVPKEVSLPEGQGADRREGNYAFSGLDGHTVEELKLPAGEASRSVFSDEITTYLLNWKILHPFHYNPDFRVPNQEQIPHSPRLLDILSFEDRGIMREPEYSQLYIDHRYTDALYTQRTSSLVLHDDGSIVATDGYGSRITLANGKIRIDSAKNVEIVSSDNVLLMGKNIVLRAEQNVDISAANHDVRVKADRNLQLLGGNSGKGGVLVESKSLGDSHDYKNKKGTEVDSHGVVVKSATEFAVLSGTTTIHADDDVLIESGQGSADVRIVAANVLGYVQDSMSLFVGPSGESTGVTRVFSFGSAVAVVDSDLAVTGETTLHGKTLIGDTLDVLGDISSSGAVADSLEDNTLAVTTKDFEQTLEAKIDDSADQILRSKQAAEETYETSVLSAYTTQGQVLNESTRSQIAFSFRDGEYGDTGVFFECRWQQLLRTGQAVSTYRAWIEPAVEYQGEELYPWPGREDWLESSVFVGANSLGLYDHQAGRDIDPASGGYDAQCDFYVTTLSQGFLLVGD